jgi:hypothetical protein
MADSMDRLLCIFGDDETISLSLRLMPCDFRQTTLKFIHSPRAAII